MRKRMVWSLFCCIAINFWCVGASPPKGDYSTGFKLFGHMYESAGRVSSYNAPTDELSATDTSTNIDSTSTEHKYASNTFAFYAITIISVLTFVIITLYLSYRRTAKQNKVLKMRTNNPIVPQHKRVIIIRVSDRRRSSNNKPAQLKDEHHEIVSKASDIIYNEMCNQQFSSKVLAEKMFMSISQLNRKLNAATGYSSYHLITKIRIETAKDKLANDDKPISQVAAECGFL